jgi:hypothetical protein
MVTAQLRHPREYPPLWAAGIDSALIIRDAQIGMIGAAACAGYSALPARERSGNRVPRRGARTVS